jgi:hypothetical protein
MTRLVVFANTVMYVLIAAAALSIAMLPLSRGLTRDEAVRPVPVPPVARFTLAELSRPAFPDRNVFGADGKAWIAPPLPGAHDQKTVVAAAPGTVSGVIRLDDLQGVLSDKGFVKVGQRLGPATLREIGAGKYVLQSPSGIQEVPIDNARKKRVEELLKAPAPKSGGHP